MNSSLGTGNKVLQLKEISGEILKVLFTFSAKKRVVDKTKTFTERNRLGHRKTESFGIPWCFFCVGVRDTEQRTNCKEGEEKGTFFISFL